MTDLNADKQAIKDRLAQLRGQSATSGQEQARQERAFGFMSVQEERGLGQDPGFLTPQTGQASFGGGLSSIASGMSEQLVGALQGTSPNVRDIHGNLLRVPIGNLVETDTGPGVETPQGTSQVDPNRMVVLRDPADGRLKVFPRDDEFEESGIMSAGRAMAPGLITGPLLRAGPSTLSRARAPFEASGVEGSLAQQSGGTISRGVQTAISRLPGAGGPIERATERVRSQISNRIKKISKGLTPRPTAEAAGRQIDRGILGEGGFVARFKDRGDILFNRLDEFVPSTFKAKADNVLRAGDELTAPIEGAEASSRAVANAKTREIVDAIRSDVAGGRIPYQALKEIRTKIGASLTRPQILGDAPRGELKKLYAAITEDMKVAARAHGPEAERAFERANKFWRAGIGRIDDLHTVVNKADPEAIFRAALQGTREGGTRIRRVLRSLRPHERDAVVGATLMRMGRASGSLAETADDKFLTSTFMTNWNNLSDEARDALFLGARSQRFRKDLDTVIDVANGVRRVERTQANPSGNAQSNIRSGTLGAFLISAITGNFDVATGIATGVVGVNLTARLITWPRFVRWLAKSTEIPASRAPQHIARLVAIAREASLERQQALQEFMTVIGQGEPGVEE